MRTYISFYDSTKHDDYLTYQAMVMFHLILEGPELTRKEMVELFRAPHIQGVAGGISGAVTSCERKGWISRPKRGVYRLTAAGRNLWEPSLDERFENLL